MGTLMVGKLADFVILDRDILALALTAPLQIPQVAISATFVSGVATFRNPSFEFAMVHSNLDSVDELGDEGSSWDSNSARRAP
jgi:hypothetical protein